MYSAGEYVICRSGGVWRIERIQDDKVCLAEHETSSIQICSPDVEIVRLVADKETLQDAIDRVGYIQTIQAVHDKQRHELYEDAMQQYEEVEWIRVIKTVYLRQQERRLPPEELAYSTRAKAYLHGEISVRLGMPVDAVEAFISQSVLNDEW